MNVTRRLLKDVIKITPPALRQFKTILKDNKYESIRFELKSGGCSGFEYNLIPTNEPPSKFDEIVVKDDVNIQVCGQSIVHILGTEIDWQNDIMGSSFRFNNPNATAQCGCAKSFSPF
jgi:iron-sulfur cluster assembly accessory protein